MLKLETVTDGLYGSVVERAVLDRDALARVLVSVFAGKTARELAAFFTNEFIETMEFVDLCLGKNACNVYPLNEQLQKIAADESLIVTKIESYLSNSRGLGRSGEGETFYEIRTK